MTERIKLLMTQENAENMNEVKSTLEQHGLSVSFCMRDGEEVISRVASDEPDVVIMDLFMTHIDSIGVMRAIRRQKPDKLPMFVVYSTFGRPGRSLDLLASSTMPIVGPPPPSP